MSRPEEAGEPARAEPKDSLTGAETVAAPARGPETSARGKRIGPYEVIRELGRGGMGKRTALNT